MSYFKNRRALGDDTGGAVCRTGAAAWNSTNNAWWVPVQDASGKAYVLMQTDAILALPMCKAAGSSSSGGGIFDSIIKGLTEVVKAKVTPGSTTVIQGGSGGGGMSTTTKVALAGAGALGLLLILRSRRGKKS